MTDALHSEGVTLHYSDAGSPTTFTKIGGVVDINGPGGSAKVIDSSDLDSTSIEKIMGLPDEGQVTFTLKLDPDSAAHTALRQARTARTKLEFKITLTDTTPTTITFSGYVTTFPLSIPLDDKITVNVGIEVTGTAVWA